MVLASESINKIRLGRLSPITIEILRLLRDFFGITFKLDADEQTNTVVCTCRGIGFKNLSKRVY
jgi:RNA 3'-terminal phosphate cyclase-like protein